MDPESGLLRWGNFDGTLLLSSRVFEADDAGRSYRLRPGVASVWLANVTLPRGLSAFFLVPDGSELPDVIRGCANVVPGSRQTTNSWGCRGPEPDTGAGLRGIVLGDSFMQGLFVGDDDTPPARLQAYLREHADPSAYVLNTGHLGYSPEQYYHTLLAYHDRLRPHFVVVSVCDNDFGKDGWDESAYWLSKISQFCRTRQLTRVVVPVPRDLQMTSRRQMGDYQGRLSNLSEATGVEFCDPIEDFVNEDLRLLNARRARGDPSPHSPLYNRHINDGHFSAVGSDVWARAVGRRLVLLLERARLRSKP
jgi:lysophospholipase L1-like esterase